MYAAINAVGVILLVFGTAIYILFLLFRWCCNACCSSSSKRVSQQRPPAAGKGRNEDARALEQQQQSIQEGNAQQQPAGPASKAASASGNSRFVPKPVVNRRRFVLTYGCMGLATCFMATIGILGHINGGSQLLAALDESSESTSGAADVVENEVGPMQAAFMASMYHFTVPTLKALNDTVFQTISIDEIINDMEVTNTTLGKLPQAVNLQNLADDLDGIKNNLLGSLDGISGDVQALDALKTGIVQNATLISSQLKDTADGIRNLSTVLDSTKTTVTELTSARDALLGPSGNAGYVGSLRSDLDSFTRGNNPGLLADTTYTAAAETSPSSMKDVVTGDINGQKTNLDALIAKLENIRSATSDLPNYNSTADNLIAMNNTINDLLAPGGNLDDLTAELNEINTIQNNFPDASELNTRVMALLDAADTFSCGDLTAEVQNIEDIVNQLPDKLNEVISEISKISNVRDMIEVLYNILVIQKERVQNNLYNITRDTEKIFNDLNGTITDVLDQVDDISGTLTDAIDSIETTIDFAEVFTILESCTTSLDSALGGFDRAAITLALNAFTASTSNVNVTEYLLQVEQIRTLLEQVDIPEHFVGDLHSLQVRREKMETLLVRAVGPADADYRLLVKGYCSSSASVRCSTDADCATFGTCSGIASFRCKDTSTSCAQDSDCTAPSYCLNDVARATELRLYLNAFASSNVAPDVSSLKSSLDSIASSSAFDLSSVNSGIDSAISAIGTSADQIDADRVLLNEVIDAANGYDVSQIETVIDDARDAVNQVDLSQVNSTLDSMAEIQDQVADSVEDAIEVAYKVKSFFYDEDGLLSHFAFFSQGNLESLAQNGFGNLIRDVFGRFDSIVDYFTDALSPVYEFDGFGLRKNSEDAAWTFDRIQDRDARDKYGSLYYLLSLSNSSMKKVVGPEDPNADTIIADQNGDNYDNGEYCITKECFQNTADYISTYPLVDDSTTGGSVDVTFESVVGYVWIAPAIAAFIGLITLLCPLFTANNKWRRCPATCWLICVILQLGPFLILTGVVFPIAVLSSDSCTSYTYVGQKYVTAYGDPLCDNVGGKGTINACTFEGRGISVTLDLEAISYGLLGDCSRANANGNDAFGDPLRSLSTQLRGKLSDIVRKELNKNQDILNDVNPAVKDIFVDSATALGDVLALFVDSNADSVLTCSRMAAVLNEAAAPVCEDGAGSFSWYLAMLYLMAWCMCCCGLPAGCAVQAECDWREKERLDFEKRAGLAASLERGTSNKSNNSGSDDVEDLVEAQVAEEVGHEDNYYATSKGRDEAAAMAMITAHPGTVEAVEEAQLGADHSSPSRARGNNAAAAGGGKAGFSLFGFGAKPKEAETRPSAVPAQYYDVDQDDVYGTDA